MIITEYWPIGVFSHESYQRCEVLGPDWILHVDVSVK